ncbi:hypothetical protein [Amycolatopsis thermoflava]|uniref:hypothetical protein n=1 Tax=Amycolatopsis thermoflava TaxID=84480 RepID=UPI0003F5505D|nr:hypothetical protein [Amycolatopsis thermoflava]
MTGGVEIDVDRIAAAVLARPHVTGLHGGRFGEIATYLPGRRVHGVRIRFDEITVGVVGRYPATVREISDDVRTVVAALPGVGGRAVHVHVADLIIHTHGSAEGIKP